MKYIPYVIFGLLATVYAVRTIRKALNEPPDEERCYDSYDAMAADGVEPEWDPNEWDPWVDGPRG